MSDTKEHSIYCCECASEVQAVLVSGTTIYPHRPDLCDQPFWQCPTCSNYVGCHHKTKDRTRPLGVIPNGRIRVIRRQIHDVLDPLWNGDKQKRKELYRKLSEALGFKFHAAQLRSEEECLRAPSLCKQMVLEEKGDE